MILGGKLKVKCRNVNANPILCLHPRRRIVKMSIIVQAQYRTLTS